LRRARNTSRRRSPGSNGHARREYCRWSRWKTIGALARIISKYADLPCDYADASLVWLGGKTLVLQIATIDQGDFSVYRVDGRRRFRILIGEP